MELSRCAIDGRLDGSGCLDDFSGAARSFVVEDECSVGVVLFRFLVEARLF